MKQLLTEVNASAKRELIREKSTLYYQGEVPRRALYILDGIVRAYTISDDGEECIARLYGKGDLLPLSWLNNNSSTSLFYYEAISDVRAAAINKRDFWHVVNTNPACMREYMDYLMLEHASMLLRINGLTQSRALEKLAYALYYLMFQYGREVADGTFALDVSLTQSQLAQLIGQTRENTAKTLKVLKEKRVVDYKGSNYTIYKNRLESFLGEDSFQDLKI